ncbi:EpsG family protein [Yeosuana marina]|uniref:EpsG family protein n=1 Tax=Yeosuana marina TaxID=1565536 RepID=UPI0014215683|nr:EpsG family protein [Yeosuana marina]
MITFIPAEIYYDLYIYFSFFLVIANLLHAYTLSLNSEKNLKFLRTSGIILFLSVILYIGLRPVSRYFGDMGAYRGFFHNYSIGFPVTSTKDVVFHYYMKFLSNFVSVPIFFLITAFLYIFPMYLISKKNFNNYWFYAFLLFVVSFSFFSYGTNGIRNGLATSLFLWGICFPNKKILMIILFILASLVHKSLLLPIAAYVLTLFYNKPKTFLKSWVIAIPTSFIFGSLFISLFTILGFGDDRLEGYLSSSMDASKFSNTGFRWDFLFYSAFPVFAGWYFIIKKKFKDEFYFRLYNTYLICNTFWILIIRANFSNRFAYLSWFLMAIVIIYPLLKQQFFKNQQIVIAKVVTAYFMFTFLMYFIYYDGK